MSATVSAEQRFTQRRPCPICGGWANLPRGKGTRCAGYIANNDKYIYCTRKEHAGTLPQELTDPASWRHYLGGDCRCGATHRSATPTLAPVSANGSSSPITDIYKYQAADGNVSFEICRKADKGFLARQPGGTNGLGEVDRVLFRLPRVLAAVKGGETIFIAEGEKDVLAIEQTGATATCNPFGAEKWADGYSETLRGAKRVVVIVDKDEPGRRHALKVRDSLARVGVQAELVQAAVGHDAADHLAAGRTLEDLEPFREIVKLPATKRLLHGDEFILDEVPENAAVWGGASGSIAWSKGEGLIIVGPDGIGKTTLMQQLALARIGLRSRLLGMRVEPTGGKILYIAADRPRQAQRSFARMVNEDDREILREKLIVWKGPLPFVLNDSPTVLADFLCEHEVDTVFLDCLKDVAVDLATDEGGSRINAANQEVLARGIEICIGHHTRKKQSGGGPPKTLDDLYGSRLIFGGCGSVFLLYGEAGDAIVDCYHRKQPAEELGPWKLRHDHEKGETTLHETGVDLLALATASAELTVGVAAAALFETTSPSPNQLEKARRRLDGLAKNGLLNRADAHPPKPTVYHPPKTA